MKDKQKAHKTEYLQAIFDRSADGLMLCDADGQILLLNKAAEKLNAVKSAELVGMKVQTLLRQGRIDRSATKEVLDSRRQVSVIQKSPNSAHTLLVTGTPVFGSEGNISYVVVNERDISLIESMRQELEQVRQESERMRSELSELALLELSDNRIVAHSDSMKHSLRLALKLAGINASNILIQGESGTGKGLLAKFIHKKSTRRKSPFIQINCAALPENLLEAELFGYKKGAFTGANEKGKTGLLELAAQGTLFLDEIGELPANIQAKLLKYLDDHEVLPLGGTIPKKIECSIIAATNRNLEILTGRNQFRLDLYHRLRTFVLTIPPLRERPEDILELVRICLKKYNKKYKRRTYIGSAAYELLKRYPFPGNVRELINIIKQAVVISDRRFLDDHIIHSLSASSSCEGVSNTATKKLNLPQQIQALERQMYLKASRNCRTTRQVSSFLGVSQATAVRKLKKHNIELAATG